MPNIILKKTWKLKPSGFQVANEKSFSLHGSPSYTTEDMIQRINRRLASIRNTGTAKTIQFRVDKAGHYSAEMNHDYQKYHEEDAIVAIIDCMEELGWNFRFQWDSEMSSDKMSGSSYTKREMFIFHK